MYGKRGVGKSSLLRQIQNMATGDYGVARNAGLAHLIPENRRKYYTVFYTCDSAIKTGTDLLQRLCSDTDENDGLLRLVPNQGKELVEFTRSETESSGVDVKVAQWGTQGANTQSYKQVVQSDIVQTFRNFVSAILTYNNSIWSKRDGVLILIDEFDVVDDKSGLGSLFKALSSDTVKFAICGIGQDINSLVSDHASVERLVEQGVAHVAPMPREEIFAIFRKAEELTKRQIRFDDDVIEQIAVISEGYPYFAQLIGKSCVDKANTAGTNHIDAKIYAQVLDDIRTGKAFPNLEARYKRAVGESDGRAIILTLLAEEKASLNDHQGSVSLRNIRSTAQELDVDHIDQLVPRLVDKNYGPALEKLEGERGTYEFVDPVFRAYVKLRS